MVSLEPHINQYKVVSAPVKPEIFTPEWALFSFLSEWTPEDIGTAIRTNMQVDFSSYVGMVIDYAMGEILKKFEMYRPDLHKVLSSKEGKIWLKERIMEALTPK